MFHRNCPYFWNTKTREVTWHLPPGSEYTQCSACVLYVYMYMLAIFLGFACSNFLRPYISVT